MTKPTLQQYEAELEHLHKRISRMELALAKVEKALGFELAKENPVTPPPNNTPTDTGPPPAVQQAPDPPQG